MGDPVAQARAQAASYYQIAAEYQREIGSLTVAAHQEKTAARILSGDGDHHPYVVAALQGRA